MQTSIEHHQRRPLSAQEETRRIQKWIRYADTRLRRKYAFLQYQDALGLGITLGSAGGMLAMGGLYIAGLIPFWICIIANAIFASFLHEIEHDLIHNLYARTRPRVQNFMFWMVWLFRSNVVNPWFRREIHLLHHRVSGNPDDAEERFIGNGMPLGFKRLLTMIDARMALKYQGPSIFRAAGPHLKKIDAPIKIGFQREIFFLLWYVFLIWGALSLMNAALGSPIQQPAWLDAVQGALNTAAVVYLIPCWWRQTAIQVVSSNMHYYDDVNGIKGLRQQTQVLDSWLVLPLHLFCFNFGATHGIHHFVVNQPFYLRQAIAPFVRPALRRYGVPFNDFRSMLRGNRPAVSGVPGSARAIAAAS
jgi:fatty acid desaturase